jgi:hypothetical protein
VVAPCRPPHDRRADRMVNRGDHARSSIWVLLKVNLGAVDVGCSGYVNGERRLALMGKVQYSLDRHRGTAGRGSDREGHPIR